MSPAIPSDVWSPPPGPQMVAAIPLPGRDDSASFPFYDSHSDPIFLTHLVGTRLTGQFLVLPRRHWSIVRAPRRLDAPLLFLWFLGLVGKTSF